MPATAQTAANPTGVPAVLPAAVLQRPPVAAPGRRGEGWRRWGAGLGSAVGLVVLVTLYGWRYGFTELPEPVSGTPLDEQALFAPAELPATNFWHPVRSLARAWMHTAQASSIPAGMARMPGNLTPPPVRGPSGGWPYRRAVGWPATAELEAALQAALAAPDWRPPREMLAEDRLGMETLLAYLEHQASAALEAGDMDRVFEYWMVAWQISAALVPGAEFTGFFDERGPEMINALLAGPFRRQALQGPPVSPAVAHRILAGLAGAGRRATLPAVAYARQVLRGAGVWQSARVADWSRVTRSAQVAGMLIRQDMMGLFGEVLNHISGWRRRAEPNYHGAAHLLRPLGQLIEVAQIAAARPGDFDRMERACLSVVLTGAGGPFAGRPGPPATLLGPGAEPRGWWQRAFDRPAVWRLARMLPPPEPVLESWRQWRLYLESCRLTLALRVYRELHGRWPERLEALVPELLEAVPEDPFAPGSPIRYACTGDFWQFESAGRRTAWAPAGPEQPYQRVFRSTEFDSPIQQPSGRVRR